MDVHPTPDGGTRLWHHDEHGFTALGVWTERQPGHGEDADPLVLFHRSAGHGMLSVFDGVGGAGRATAGRAADGHVRTQAWVASRWVRALTEEWFAQPGGSGLGGYLTDRLPAPDTRRARIRGTIHREFPTTLAALDFFVERGEARWDALWAGDSRCYVADPRHGLQQLSQDDTDGRDALELLLQDPPMTNVISTDRPFALNNWRGRADLPCVLLCATDGFFGYVTTPALFEHVLWEALVHARDPLHWAARVAERVAGYTGDDASLALVALGFSGFVELREAFRGREELLRERHAVPMSRAPEDDRAAVVTARERSWRDYRHDYERLLPGEGERT